MWTVENCEKKKQIWGALKRYEKKNRKREWGVEWKGILPFYDFLTSEKAYQKLKGFIINVNSQNIHMNKKQNHCQKQQ